jgi:hypothetical protein
MIAIRGTRAQRRMTAMTQLLFYVSIAADINGVANRLGAVRYKGLGAMPATSVWFRGQVLR